MPDERQTPSKDSHSRRGSTSVVAIALIAVAGLGVWFWTSHASESAQASGAGPVRATLHLETFVLNLADVNQRSYLRVGIDLALTQDAKRAEELVPLAEVRDTILGVLSDAKGDDLVTSAGKTKLKKDILHSLQDRVPQLGAEDVYASAQVDQRKVGQLALAIQVAFQELGVFPTSNTKLPLDVGEPMPLNTVQAIDNAKHNTDLSHVASRPLDEPTATSDEANLELLQAELQQALQHEIKAHTVALHRESEGLVISLREFGFFDSGSATLRPSAMPALDRIASILAVRTCHLRIEGHTDDVPIHTAQMASNWELSTARSTELVRLLIVRHRFSPERLSAAGYAQYHPIVPNDTPQNRAQNRRVDLVILSERITRRTVPSETANNKPSPAIP